MAYWYKQFNFKALNDLVEVETETGVDMGDVPFYRLASGGGMDGWGGAQVPPGVEVLTLAGEINGDSLGDVWTKLAELKSVAGTVADLERQTYIPGLVVQQATARLVKIAAPRKSKEDVFKLPVKLTFQKYSPYWRGDAHGYLQGPTDNLFTLNTSPKTITVANEGNAPVKSVQLDIIPAGSAITALRVQIGTIIDFTWADASGVAVGKTLRIDSGAGSVTNDGVDAYSKITWNSGHAVDDWFRLAASGNTDIIITRTGGNASSTAQVSYYGAWL